MITPNNRFFYLSKKTKLLVDIVEQYDDEKKKYLLGIWEQMLTHLATKNDPKKIFSFLNKTGIISIDEHEKTVYIGAPNEFVLSQVKRFFSKALKETTHEIYNPQFDTKMVVYTPFQQNGKNLLPDLKKLLNMKETKKTELKKIEK